MTASSTRTLEGKVAIGKVPDTSIMSNRGIGAAIALTLASRGADVVINYRAKAEAAEQVAAQARKDYGVRAIAVKADVSDKAAVMKLFEIAKKELGHIDIVMSNSGIEHFGSLAETTEEEIDKVFAVNVKGQYFVAQSADRFMEDGGRLILMSSVSAVWGVKHHAIYSASKAAITGMVKCLACDLGERKITVNCIAPGGIKSDMAAENAKHYVPNSETLSQEEIEAKVAAMSPLNRFGVPEDVAGVVAFLASPDAQWLTGQTIHVGGGVHMATA